MNKKHIKSLVVITALLFSSFASANEEDAASEEDIKMMYNVACVADSEEAKALPEQHQLLQGILIDPVKKSQELLDQGSKEDTGAFGLIMACGLVNMMKEQLNENGCKTDGNKVIDPKPAIKLCEDLIKRIGQ